MLSLYAVSVGIYRSFFSLGRFNARHFILFVALVKRIVSLVSLSDFFLVHV